MRQAAFREAWRLLHLFAVDNVSNWRPESAEEWYAEWCNTLPDQDCSCSIDWAQLTRKFPPDFTSPAGFFTWTVDRHNDVNKSLNKRVLSREDAYLRYRFPTFREKLQFLITWDDFTRDTLLLAQEILDKFPDVSGIAGCPRSGMRAAAELALRLDVPLYEASVDTGLRRCAGGSRLRNAEVHGLRVNSSGTIVVIEDSTCSGTSVTELKQHPDLVGLPVFAVYAGNHGRTLVDGYAVCIDLPHWFEWNFFQNGQILRDYNVGIDWDGVLNTDCLPCDDDDGPRYISWLEHARPIRLARGYQIPYIITARREAYRTQAEAWLARYGINYGRLIMFPGSFEERSRTNLGHWKAEMCDQFGVGIFVESSLMQAELISRSRNQIVLCTERDPRCENLLMSDL